MSDIIEYIFNENKLMTFLLMFVLATIVVEGTRLLTRFLYKPVGNSEYRMKSPSLRKTEEYLIRAKNAAVFEREFLMATKIRDLIKEIHDIQDGYR
jgi:hypothetical protein